MFQEKFSKCSTLEELRSIYKTLAMENHPDKGGDEENFKILQNQYEYAAKSIYLQTAQDFATENDREFDAELSAVVQEALGKILHYNVTIDIVGGWIYVFDCYAIKDDLKEFGFWFSGKHKAWIFSGKKKSRFVTKGNLDSIKAKFGSSTMRKMSALA